MKLWQEGEGLGVLFRDLESRDWGVFMGSWSFTSWSVLCSSSLYIRDPLRLQGDGWVWGLSATCRLQGPVFVGVAYLQVGACWLASESEVGGGGAHGFALGTRA